MWSCAQAGSEPRRYGARQQQVISTACVHDPGTRAGGGILTTLARQPARPDAVSAPLPGSSQTDLLRHDLQALPTWRARWQLVREHLFPASSYMRAKYGVRSNLLLPALYSWRVVAAQHLS